VSGVEFLHLVKGSPNKVSARYEGSELSALKGALGTLERFKPSLAICVYHKPNDWVDIPLFIHSLNLGYKMWLDHFTIYPEETVLYCRTF
jgi:hypothetical protein